MATIVLTAVGTAVGGPLGGAIGAMIGQQIDSRLFAPKARQGPRLGDLTLQTSSYGSAIPKIFGTMRVAGTVIWATDLQERRSTSGGGKGQPKSVGYSYSASFAVALSGRPIGGVGRIWADGKLLRGAGGDFKSATGFRLYLGGEAQAVDPLVASVEGIGQAPAHRGIAYALFEHFELADYGNRIPSLTFEVEADSGPVSVGGIAEELSAGEIGGGETPVLGGYAASGDSVRGAIEALADVVPLSLVQEAERPVLRSVVGGAALEIGREAMAGKTERVRQSGASVPAEVTIAYHDPARDFQTGLQRASRSGGPGLLADRRALPAAVGADIAKGFAEARLEALWAGRASAKLPLVPAASGVRPGAVVKLEGEAGLWRVARWTLERFVAEIELVRIPGGGRAAAAPASPGRPIGHPDVAHGATSLALLDIPLWTGAPADRPVLYVAAAGVEPGWRRAALSASYDGGATWTDSGVSAPAAIMGHAVDVLGPAGSALIDLEGSVEVALLNDAMALEGRDDAALGAGVNLALLGRELIQFGAAEPLGEGRYRLSRLLRGRRGSEWAAPGHEAGETFVLMEAGTLAVLEPPAAAVGGVAQVLASGIGDGPEGVEARLSLGGEAMRPPSPVHLTWSRSPGGDLALRWVRRSRTGWDWLDGAETPLGEEREAYRLTLSGSDFQRTVELSSPAWLYSAAEQAADGAAGPIEVLVVQVGSAAVSRPALALVP
jgi:hypothetical protein